MTGTPQRVTLLTNPASGPGRGSAAAQRAVVRLQRRGVDVVELIGSDAAHARQLLDEALDAHEAAGGGLVKGIRHSGARDPHPEHLAIPGRGAEGLYADPAFHAGVARIHKL